jgi:glutamate synthase (NADPH/NADH) large chain
MMRVCHLDTCPVGIATQNPDLRARFTGRAEHVIAFFRFIAEEVRVLMASLGARTMDELIGRVDLLASATADDVPRARLLQLGAILDASHLALTDADGESAALRSRTRAASPPPQRAVDQKMIDLAEPAIFEGARVRARLQISNRDRAVGAMLGSEITRRRGEAGLDDDTIVFDLEGSAGQSLGAFLPRGVTLLQEGDANDYVGKGLSGGRIAVFPPKGARFDAARQVIAGNVALYGATSGEAFFAGRVGERFAVRNSGARAVVEGVGDHGCEYMTGGIVVVLGPTGRNFAAGMSGGIAYLLDDAGVTGQSTDLELRINPEMVALRPLDDDDRRTVRALVERHLEATSSALAASLLASWEERSRRFVKVMPLDFERAIADGRVSTRPESLAPAAE